MANSPRLGLPYLVAGQAQKELSHNDALNDLESLAQISVINRTTSTPPATPSDGDSYIIGASPTGAWAGNANAVASYYSGWRIKPAKTGWIAYVQAEAVLVIFDGTAWNIFKGVVPLGSAAAPSYSFVGDSDTGIYSPGANQLAVATAGVQRLTVDATGNTALSGGLTVSGTITGSITGNAATVTTNANLTGDVTSTGNTTTVAKIAGVAVGTPTGTGNVVFSAAPTLTGTLSTANHTITSVSVNALAVGANGTTNPVLSVNTSTASVAAGISIVGGAAGFGTSISAISSATNDFITLQSKGVESVRVHSSTGGTAGPTTTPTMVIRNVNTTVNNINCLAFWTSSAGKSAAQIEVINEAHATPTGSMNFYTANSGGTLVQAFRIDSSSNVVLGTAALATTATSGFLYIPTCAGAPTGVPTANTGRVPIIFDTTNNKLCIYNGAWKTVALI